MTKIGPIQIFAFQFEDDSQLKGAILNEIAALRGRGVVRFVDVIAIRKGAHGNITRLEMSDLSSEERQHMGETVAKLLGLGGLSAEEVKEVGSELASEKLFGFGADQLQQIVEDMAPNSALGVLMIEHQWAIPLRDSIRRSGGVPMMQAMLTPEAVVMVGRELEAMAEAEMVIEVAETIKTAAILDAMIAIVETAEVIEQAEAIKTAAVADTLRTLIIAGMIEEAAAAEALEAVMTYGLIADAAYAEAEKAVEAATAQDRQVFAAIKAEEAAETP